MDMESSAFVLHVGRGEEQEEEKKHNNNSDFSIRIVKCPVCAGAGSIPCIIREEEEFINPYCMALPLRTEERCNCCDGRGWVKTGQKEMDPFCHVRNDEGSTTTTIIMMAAGKEKEGGMTK
jgi:hypothetical protein